MAVAGPLLATPDFSKTEVVLLLQSILERDNRRQERAQLARMKAVRIFNPLHVLGNGISVSDIDGLKIFKLHEHPAIRPQIEVTKTQVMKYQALAASIKPFEERKDSKGKDTFDLSDWRKSTVHRYNDDQKKAHTDSVFAILLYI